MVRNSPQVACQEVNGSLPTNKIGNAPSTLDSQNDTSETGDLKTSGKQDKLSIYWGAIFFTIEVGVILGSVLRWMSIRKCRCPLASAISPRILRGVWGALPKHQKLKPRNNNETTSQLSFETVCSRTLNRHLRKRCLATEGFLNW